MSNGKKMKVAVLTSGGDSAGMNAVVRAVVKTAIIKYVRSTLGCLTGGCSCTAARRGCETWIVREGYEGLVRGNSEGHRHTSSVAEKGPTSPRVKGTESQETEGFVHNLRFGDGELLKDGTGDHPGGRTLKGRYIVRVGWDDVRGWFSEVSLLS